MIETLFDTHVPDITITYEDARGSITTRTIKPQGVRTLKEDRIGLCGWCTLRQDRRTFAVKNIRTLHQNMHSIDIWETLNPAIEKLNLFQSLKTRTTLPWNNPELVQAIHALNATIGYPLSEALLWWNESDKAIYPDTNLTNWIHQQSGHDAMLIHATLNDLLDFCPDTPSGAIALWTYNATYLLQAQIP